MSYSLAQDNQLTVSKKSLLSKTNLKTDFLMGGASFAEGQDESQFVQLLIRPNAEVEFNKDFSVIADVMFILNSARTQTRYQNPIFNTINLMELVASYHPSSFINFEVGAINQDHYGSRMFIADRSFPGLLLKSGWGNKKISLNGKFQYAIPTSTSFESDRTNVEALPSLQTEGIEVLWIPRKWVNFKANVNHFSYSDLPSIVAFQSGLLGNQVIGTDKSESFFAYQFQGFSQAYDLGFNYTPVISQKFEVGVIENLKAPQDRRRSQWVGTTLGLDFSNLKVSPKYALFFAESDSVPAIYSGFELGRNNRDGELVGMQLDFKRMGFSVKVNYIESQRIQAKAPQSDMNYLELLLEVKNVSL